MSENFLNLRKKMGIQIQEAQNIPTKMTPKSSTPICVIIKLSKVREMLEKFKRKVTHYVQESAYIQQIG